MPKPNIRYDGHLCAGHLLVWTWRKLLAGQEECPLLAAEYRCIAGTEAEGLLCLFANFLQAIGHGSRRILSVGRPHVAGLTPDEMQLLRLVAAAQAGDAALLDAHLRWLVKRDTQVVAMAAASLLMARFRDCNVVLPQVAPVEPPLRPMLEMVWRNEKPGGDTAGLSQSSRITTYQ